MRRQLKKIQPVCFAALQRVLFLRGRDVGAELCGGGGGPLLVIAPHPDDETLGCGAAIMRAVDAGRRVDVVVVCDGRHSQQSAVLSPTELARVRRREVNEACRRMGVPEERVWHLGFEDRHAASAAVAIGERLEGVAREVGPACILAPSGIDKHPDHRAIHGVVVRLAEQGRLRAEGGEGGIYEYPVWFWTAGTWMTASHPAVRRAAQLAWRPLRTAVRSRPLLVSTEGYLERKRRALEAFESQMRNITGEAGWPVLEEGFLASFFRRYELYFPLNGAGAPARAASDAAEVPSGALAWGWGE